MKFNNFRIAKSFLYNKDKTYEIYVGEDDNFNRNIIKYFDYKKTIGETRINISSIVIKGISNINEIINKTFKMEGKFLFNISDEEVHSGNYSIDRINFEDIDPRYVKVIGDSLEICCCKIVLQYKANIKYEIDSD